MFDKSIHKSIVRGERQRITDRISSSDYSMDPASAKGLSNTQGIQMEKLETIKMSRQH
ncbi:putative repressor [Salmonella phage 41]|nr:putative repressor [Salmonella phage 41]